MWDWMVECGVATVQAMHEVMLQCMHSVWSDGEIHDVIDCTEYGSCCHGITVIMHGCTPMYCVCTKHYGYGVMLCSAVHVEQRVFI